MRLFDGRPRALCARLPAIVAAFPIVVMLLASLGTECGDFSGRVLTNQTMVSSWVCQGGIALCWPCILPAIHSVVAFHSYFSCRSFDISRRQGDMALDAALRLT